MFGREERLFKNSLFILHKKPFSIGEEVEDYSCLNQLIGFCMKKKINIMFVCHGNICRSPMAEFVMKDLVKKEGLEDEIFITSSATSTEELGNNIYYKTQETLEKAGIKNASHQAIRLKHSDNDKYDFFIGMDEENQYYIMEILRRGAKNKIYKLLDFTDTPYDIEDPWYTRNFDKVYKEILKGCEGLLSFIKEKYKE